jgi:hypothetical protein
MAVVAASVGGGSVVATMISLEFFRVVKISGGGGGWCSSTNDLMNEYE